MARVRILAQSDGDLLDELRGFFDSTPWLLFRNLTLFLVLVLWVASVFWVYKDARRRIADPWLVAIATLLGTLPPFLGPFIYLLFRPPEYLDDVRERELEISAMEEQLRRAHCPSCSAPVKPDFLACPFCAVQLREACRGCKAPLERDWQVCPYCQEEVATPTVIGLEARREKPGRSRGTAPSTP